MDPEVSRWVAEFLLRSSVPDSLTAKILAVLPLCGADPRLKKTLLLRTLQSMLSKASITETALEILEHVEEIDRNDAVPVTDSMRRAYCAVAVECTVKYLAASSDESDGEYLSAVKRIWRGRVAEIEHRRSELFSGELARWRDDVEAALWNSTVSERLESLNTRNEAFKEVKLYLKEAWGIMGLSFLDSLAAMSKKKMRRKKNKNEDGLRGGYPVRAVVAEGCAEGVCGFDSEAEPVRECGERGDLVGGYDDNDNGNDNGNHNGNDDDDIVNDDGAFCMEDVDLNGGNEGKEQLQERCEDSVNGNEESAKGEKVSPLVSEKGNLQLRRKLPAFRRCHRGVKISGAEELDLNKTWSKDDHVLSAEVKKARESLKSSSLELREMVEDPLHDALYISEIVRSKLASKDTNHEQPIENQSGDADIPNSNPCRSIVLYQPIDANLGKTSSVHHHQVQHSNLRKRRSTAQHSNSVEHKSTAQRANFMEQKSTARSFEWDDSIENMPQGVLPRRKKRKWTSLEEETLRTGVKMFGEGNWATIRSFYSNIFQNRRGGDLKDKWRNMLR